MCVCVCVSRGALTGVETSSWCRLQLASGGHYPNVDGENFDAQQYMRLVGSLVLKQIALMATRLHEFREKNPHFSERITDVSFPRLGMFQPPHLRTRARTHTRVNAVADPIATVKALYRSLGYHYSQEFEDNMRRYLQHEAQHTVNKYGKATPPPSISYTHLHEIIAAAFFARLCLTRWKTLDTQRRRSMRR